MPSIVFTIGHSTRPIAELLGMLNAHGIRRLVDVRTVPASRRNPQYGRDSLASSLSEAGIDYQWMPSLGGLRRPRKDSPNAGWRNESFRGYADHMQTDEFREAVEALLGFASERSTAIMCAEAVPWRCHRSLVADALTARGVPVLHVMTAERADPHRLTSFAVVEDETVTYPAPA